MGNPFKAVTKKINGVTKKVNNGFKKVGSELNKIGNVLKCPISIFSNIPKCGLYFIEDLIMLLVWFVLWLICFVVLYLPIAFFMQIYCVMGGVYFCVPKLSPTDICPSKQFITELVELCFEAFGIRLLLRTSKDVKQCYCIPPVKMAFQPLTKMKYTGDLLNAATGNDEDAYTERLLIAFVIFGLIMAVNMYGFP
jgi:hypothetical protein